MHLKFYFLCILYFISYFMYLFYIQKIIIGFHTIVWFYVLLSNIIDF